MTNEELIKCIQAEDAGREIQCRAKIDGWWVEKLHDSWNTTEFEYRVEPKPREFWIVGNTKYDSPEIAHKASIARVKEIIHVREILDEMNILRTERTSCSTPN